MGLSACWLACSEDPESTEVHEDFPIAAPDHCTFARAASPLCDFDAPDAPSNEGGAGGDAPLEDPSTGCLVREQLTLSCPSQVAQVALAEGVNADGAVLDALVVQAGRIGAKGGLSLPNDSNYVEVHRVEASGSFVNSFDVVEPFASLDSSNPSTVLALLAASPEDEARVLRHTKGDSGSQLFADAPFSTAASPAPFELNQAPLGNSFAYRSQSGEGLFVAQPYGGAITIVRNAEKLEGPAAEAPATLEFALSENSAGEFRMLRSSSSGFELLGGDWFTEVDWSYATTTSFRELDLIYVEQDGVERPVALWRGDTSGNVSLAFLDGDDDSLVPVGVGAYANECPGFSIGITCDDCPVGQRCAGQEDIVLAARLFESDGRVFVASVVSHEEMLAEMVKDTNPFLGCSCTAREISSTRTADFLVVSEVRSREGAAPELIPMMRRELGAPGVYATVRFSRTGRGGLTLLLGDDLTAVGSGLIRFPSEPSVYQLLRLGAQ